MKPEESAEAATMDEVVEEVLKMFDGFEQMPLVPESTETSERLLTGCVRLTGADGVGSIGICASRRAIAALAPFPDADAIDWMGELVNLAAGRLKYALLFRTRLRLQQSVPTVRTGDASPTTARIMHALRSRRWGDTLRIWIDLDIPEARLREETGGELVLAPGSALVFD